MTPLEQSALLLAAAAVYSFFAGAVTRNYSQVDRLWSVLPPIYVIIWMQNVPCENIRFWTAGTLVILWGVRLTANFARRGGYRFSLSRGFYDEDYRWPILKEKIPSRFLFELFNLLFISLFQLGLIFLFTLPVWFAGTSARPWNTIDTVLTILFLAALLGELTADNQQWRFQNSRRKPENADDPRYALGFNTFGLWKYSRHPNYFCEMSQWVIIALFGMNAAGGYHWSVWGALILILLFAGSTAMAEQLTGAKYPAYREWKKLVPVWFPLPMTRSRREFLEKHCSAKGTVQDR